MPPWLTDNLLIQAAGGSKRLALIIGNSIYKDFPELDNPENDAHAMEEKLKSLGFAVDQTLYVDQTHHEMLNSVEEFAGNVRDGTTDIVFYYSGHGCSIGEYIEIRAGIYFYSEPSLPY